MRTLVEREKRITHVFGRVSRLDTSKLQLHIPDFLLYHLNIGQLLRDAGVFYLSAQESVCGSRRSLEEFSRAILIASSRIPSISVLLAFNACFFSALLYSACQLDCAHKGIEKLT